LRLTPKEEIGDFANIMIKRIRDEEKEAIDDVEDWK